MTKLTELIDRLEKARRGSNELDIAVEIALFKPDQYHTTIRANAAGTKVIYTRHDGREETFWARGWSEDRKGAIALLRPERGEG